MTVVAKFGGSSISDVEKINRVAKQIEDIRGGEQLVAVVSAMGDTTDRIIGALRSASNGKLKDLDEIFVYYNNVNRNFGKVRSNLLREFRANYMPGLVNSPEVSVRLQITGERLSAYLISHLFRENGIDSEVIDIDDTRFPLVASGQDLYNAHPELKASQQRARNFTSKSSIVVIPGYGGVKDGLIALYGRGGSDISAFLAGYALNANRIWICTDIDGIKRAVVNGLETDTVRELDIDEAMEAAFFGAKLPSDIALMPLERMFDEGRIPEVYITNAQHVYGKRTKITPKSSDGGIKLAAGRDVIAYELVNDENESGIIEFLNKMYKNYGLDWSVISMRPRRYVRIAVSERSQKGVERIINESERKRAIRTRQSRETSYVGVVGSGILTDHTAGNRAHTGIRKSGINVLTYSDPTDVSMGYEVTRRDRDRALEALYRAFFLNNH